MDLTRSRQSFAGLCEVVRGLSRMCRASVLSLILVGFSVTDIRSSPHFPWLHDHKVLVQRIYGSPGEAQILRNWIRSRDHMGLLPRLLFVCKKADLTTEWICIGREVRDFCEVHVYQRRGKSGQKMRMYMCKRYVAFAYLLVPLMTSS